ncbi:MAG: UDP-N-acetylmuramoyl-tripeptide--D-alanyl-D-alanine ligase [Oscillospiraceae bacterium]|jgi:UDP-N-acetylmuramoyl-tripeptide--D-alanyl-D-alanine ligase|nr:UDP-N-acetylmuramoyl-tripeptide--D-alanyl-D-alanine ligase [Oscillospiraceae bacterium]
MTVEYIGLCLIAAAVLVLHYGAFRVGVWMFQLHSYKPDVHRKWLKKHPLYFFRRVKNAKKPLVWTPRVYRLAVSYFLILLIAGTVLWIFTRPGIAIVAGVLLLLLPTLLFANFVNKPIESAINRRYVAEAKTLIADAKSSGLKVIGVTGSYGKTGVKFYIEKLLSTRYNVLATPESYNTTLGVVRTIRERLRGSHEYFIVEMGARNRGDIREICEIVKPDYAVITAIGEAHLESFKTIETIAETKFELVDALDPKTGIAFLNWDNDHIRKEAKRTPSNLRFVKYAAENNAADFSAISIRLSERGSTFRVRGVNFETKLIGRHNILNLTAAIAVASSMGIPTEQLPTVVRRVESVPHRLQLIPSGDSLIIDDAYNSNPDGAVAALETLSAFKSHYKILITPGMVELGEHEFSANLNFGRKAATVCDFVILIGAERTKPLAAGLRAEGLSPDRVRTMESVTDAISFALAYQSGNPNAILIENDLPDNYTIPERR